MKNLIDQAFQKIERAEFLPGQVRSQAAIDAPISIGFGQTNSQPSLVRQMLEWLAPQPGDKVLDVGSGSGWTSALLAHIVGKNGNVYAVEKIPELVEFGKNNCQRLSIQNARFFKAGETFGLPRHAPYDRILVSADAGEMPLELVEQLGVGGKMIIPIEGVIFEITKKTSRDLEMDTHPGFAFVPLVP